MASDEKNKKLCDGCTICCEHIAMELDKPESKDDFHHLMWYLLHENIILTIENDDTWMMEFKTRCKGLKNEDGLCSVYEKRPNICRDYDQDSCEKFGEGSHYKVRFTKQDELIDWIKKNTNIKNLF